MGDIILAGSTSGSITVAPPAVAGSGTLTLPTGTDTLVGKATTDTLTNKTVTAPVLSGSITGTYTLAGTPTITSPTITGASISTMASSVITSGTTVASTSGTSIDFTGIPSWVKRITVMYKGVSTNGASDYLIQLGAGSPTTTGYTGSSSINTTGVAATNYTTGFGIYNNTTSATVMNGLVTIVTLGSNVWAASGVLLMSNSAGAMPNGGSVTLGGTLDRVRFTTVNGSDTYDAGSVNILYE